MTKDKMLLLQVGDKVILRSSCIRELERVVTVNSVSSMGVRVDGLVSLWSHTDIDRIPLTEEQLEANASQHNDCMDGTSRMYHYRDRAWVRTFKNGGIWHDGLKMKYTDELQRSLRRRGLTAVANGWVLTKEEGDRLKSLGVIR